MAEPYTIGISLKSYVARHVMNEFGDPADLYCKEGKYLMDYIKTCLKRPKTFNDSKIDLNNLSVETRFVISQHDFYSCGWDVSKTHMLMINNRIEGTVKFLSRNYITIMKSFGIPINVAIRNFQREYDLPEEVFPYDTIYKDFERNGNYQKDNNIERHIKNIRKILVTNLSESRQFI